jgi:hypothetical protein
MMQQTLTTIINIIPRGCIFDSHYIIEQLIKNYSDEYINFVSQYANTPLATLTAHGKIGQEISKLNGICIKLDNESFSYNIHNNPSLCAAWQKL